MCGRYQFTAEQCEEIRQIVEAIQRKYGNCSILNAILASLISNWCFLRTVLTALVSKNLSDWVLNYRKIKILCGRSLAVCPQTIERPELLPMLYCSAIRKLP